MPRATTTKKTIPACLVAAALAAPAAHAVPADFHRPTRAQPRRRKICGHRTRVTPPG